MFMFFIVYYYIRGGGGDWNGQVFKYYMKNELIEHPVNYSDEYEYAKSIKTVQCVNHLEVENLVNDVKTRLISLI